MNANDEINVTIRVEKMTTYYKTVKMSWSAYKSLDAGLNSDDSTLVVKTENDIFKLIEYPNNIEWDNIFINDFRV